MPNGMNKILSILGLFQMLCYCCAKLQLFLARQWHGNRTAVVTGLSHSQHPIQICIKLHLTQSEECLNDSC